MRPDIGTGSYENFKVMYNGLALLHTIANKQTQFFGYMLSRMDDDNLVSMTPNQRRQAIEEIGSKTENPLTMARQHIHGLVKAGLITSLGGSDYMVNPMFANRIHDYKRKVNQKYELYLKAVAKADGTLEMEVGARDAVIKAAVKAVELEEVA